MRGARPSSTSNAELEAIELELVEREIRRRERFPTPGHLAEHLSRGRWRRARHLDVLNAKIAELERRGHGRLLVSMPPRHGKTEDIAHWTPVWYLDRHPTHEVILTGYAISLAVKQGRKCRNTIQDNSDVLRVRLAKDSKAAADWSTTEGGSMVCAGVGGGITGKGAHLLIIDDPFKDRAEADSKTTRDKVWDWWTSTAYTRLAPNAIVIILHTRWHEDDLIGRMLNTEYASDLPEDEEWETLFLPAVAEEDDPLGREVDEPLWPERFTAPRLDAIRKSVGPRDWAALYQCRPTPQDGGCFKREWMCQFYRELPSELEEQIQSWDMTFKGRERSDFVAGGVWGAKGARYYLIDQTRGRMNFPAAKAALRALCGKHPKAARKLVEGKANGPAIIDDLKDEIDGLVEVEPEGGKEARAAVASALFEAGNVWLPHPEIAPWIRDYIEELVSFPGGAHDDQVDQTSQALIHLRQRRPITAADIDIY